jgi:group I intron endonuclease
LESGIYIIKNLVNGKVYVGSAKVFRIRWNRHLNDLKKGVHSSIKLQRAYNKYGINNFEFKIIEKVKYDPVIVNRENFYINKLNSKKNGYNIADASFGDILTNHPNRKNIINRMTKTLRNTVSNMSNDERVKTYSRPLQMNGRWNGGGPHCDCGNQMAYGAECCAGCRDRTGINNPFYGKTHSEKTKNKLRAKRVGKYNGNQERAVVVGDKEYKSVSEASRKLKVVPATILFRIKSKHFKEYNYKS